MHVISREALREFWNTHPDSKASLVRWHQIVSRTDFPDFAALRQAFPSADKVDKFVVFNFADNKFRLIAAIHFNRQKVSIRHVLTHPQYDQGAWKS